MTEKIWKWYPEECELCGGDVEVFTEAKYEEGYACDGDPVKCTDCKCTGSISADEDGSYHLMNADENGVEF